jgi:hypothetical protein
VKLRAPVGLVREEEVEAKVKSLNTSGDATRMEAGKMS